MNTVKGYAQHEEEVFTQVAEARAGLLSAIQTHDAEQMANANARCPARSDGCWCGRGVSAAQGRSEFPQLQDELTGTENRIAVSRNDYNQAVNAYNAYIRQFPAVDHREGDGREAAKVFHGD